MEIFYSPTCKGFLVAGLNKIPSDAKKIENSLYNELLQKQSEGFEIFPNEFGLPETRLQTGVNDSISERKWRDAELVRADIELNKVQDSDKKAIGTVGEWRGYRKALRDWPETVGFPASNMRPTPPDYKEIK